MQNRKSVGPDLDKLNLEPEPSDRLVFQSRFVPFILKDAKGTPILSVTQQYINEFARLQPPAHIDKAGGLVARPDDDIESGNAVSDFGIILLERTRFTPAGFVLGEHILSLSLAPGEEVTIEQKTFSERSVTLEEVSETDSEVNTEVSSSLTTEISEALNKTMNDATNKGANAGISGGFSDSGASLSLSAGVTDSITAALSTTENESVRNVMVKTEKLTARRRAQHKITMKISETNRFETGNKRIIRNPNQFTPIDLVYFKLLQKFQVAQERYGVRLSWAPFIRDPGIILDQAEAASRSQIESEIPLSLPALRDRPVPSTGMGSYQKSLNNTELTNWGFTPVMMIADYDLIIAANNAGDVWDGQVSTITNSLKATVSSWGATRGTPVIKIITIETYNNGNVNVVHLVINVTTGAGWPAPQPHIYINFAAGFNRDNSAASEEDKKKILDWEAERNSWNAEVDSIKADRNARIEAAVEDWRINYRKNFDPVSSAFQLLIAQLFPLSAHDEGFEVEIWNKVFDFSSSAFQYYPCWWSNRERRNPDKAPDAFENASWMRVFLPIRPGFERQALNLIIERRLYTQINDPLKLQAIDDVLLELDKVRTAYFGGISEVELSNPVAPDKCPVAKRPYMCLAHWEELLPTDGTHLEVVQAKTTAIDDTTEQSLIDTHNMMVARINHQQVEGELTTSVKDKVSSAAAPADLDIHIGLGTKKTN